MDFQGVSEAVRKHGYAVNGKQARLLDLSGASLVGRRGVLRQQEWASVNDLISLARWPALVLLAVGTVGLVVRLLK